MSNSLTKLENLKPLVVPRECESKIDPQWIIPPKQLKLKWIGAGSYAAVYQVTNNKGSNGRIAAKVTAKWKTQNITSVGRHEAEMALKLKKDATTVGSPNVLKCYAAYENDEYIVQICDLAEGSLPEKIKYPVPIEKAKLILRQVIQGVRYLHIKNIVHRDLKPDNILLLNSKTLVICDFGIAFDTASEEEKYGVAGSTGFQAPEIFSGYKYDKKVDIWSIGAIAHLLISGVLVFDGNYKPELFSQGREMDRIKGMIGDKACRGRVWHENPDVKEFVMGCLEADTNDRLSARRALTHKFLEPAQQTAKKESGRGSTKGR